MTQMTQEQLELGVKMNGFLTAAWDLVKNYPGTLSKSILESKLIEASMWGNNVIREYVVPPQTETAESVDASTAPEVETKVCEETKAA